MNGKPSIYSLSYEDILVNSQKPDNLTIERASDYFEVLNEYFVNGWPKGQSCGIHGLDRIFTWYPGFVYCFTGYPGSGKSELLNYLTVLRALEHNIKVAMYSPETSQEELIDNLCRAYLNQNNPNIESYTEAKEWVNDHYYFMKYDGLPSVTQLLDDYQRLVNKDVSMFVTDPFNYVAEGSLDDGRGISRYLKTALSHMKTFAKVNKVLNIIVEHPHQPKPDKDGNIPRVNQFMINGGAMWNNKMDCIVGMSSNFQERTAIFQTLKMKSQRLTGVPGERNLNYDFDTGVFTAQPEFII